MIFIYDEWNRDHLKKHGIKEKDAEYVVRNAKNPYPRKIEDGKLIVLGKTLSGQYLQVVFAIKSESEISYHELNFENWESNEVKGVYLIHAMPMPDRKKQHFRRNKR